MTVTVITSCFRKCGGTIYSSKLYKYIPSELIPAEKSFHKVVLDAVRKRGDLFHIQYEYSLFHNFPLTILLLPILTLLLRLTRRPLVITFHGIISRESHKLAFLPFFTSAKLTVSLSSRIIVHNQLMKRIMVHYFHVEDEKVVVINHGADDCSKGSSGNSFGNILFLGFIRPSKGIDDLIVAMSRVKEICPKARLTIAGSNPFQEGRGYLNRLKILIEQLHLTDFVLFLDRFITEDELNNLIVQNSVVVLPYRDRFIEASGVLHRVAAFGKPVICTKTPRFLGDLRNGLDCLMVQPENPEELASAILRLLKDQTLASQLRRELQLRSISWKKVAQKHLELYESMRHQP